MAGKDSETTAWYGREAGAYTTRTRTPPEQALTAFMSLLPAGGSVLELGCGAGEDSATMLAAGFDATPTDGTAEIAAAAAKKLGRPVAVLLFENLKEVERYHGVWANACLLHVPRPNLAGILKQVHRALKPGGLFYSSFKAGTAEGRDTFGRYYNYPDEDWLRHAYGHDRWAAVEVHSAMGTGYDQEPTEWLHVLASKYD